MIGLYIIGGIIFWFVWNLAHGMSTVLDQASWGPDFMAMAVGSVLGVIIGGTLFGAVCAGIHVGIRTLVKKLKK